MASVKTVECQASVVSMRSRSSDPAIARFSPAARLPVSPFSICLSLSLFHLVIENPAHVSSAYPAGIIEQTISFGRDQQKVRDAKHDFQIGQQFVVRLGLDRALVSAQWTVGIWTVDFTGILF